MARKKPEAPQFPPEVCGVCTFACVDTDGKLYCFGTPPVPVADEGGIYWARGGPVEAGDPSCFYFKPRHHA